MSLGQIIFILISCAFFMGLVLWISYLKTKGDVNNKEGYFLAGSSLTGIFIAGSMLLTNLSAEQLIGLSGNAHKANMSGMAWEVTAGFAIIISALVFMPRYLAGAFTTLPEFLKSRYDDGMRRYSVILFMLGYGLITIPSVLYSGSIAVLRLFDIPKLFNITYFQALVLTILVIGIIGAIIAIFGGLKAVAISDTITGIGLLIIGILMPVLGFIALGKGSFVEGVRVLVTTQTHKLNAIGSVKDPVPFATIFTGMIFANLFYWGTNQYVIQRALGAKNLAECQKGVILSGFFKLLVPLMMMIPGIIAFHLFPNLEKSDLAYPMLVSKLLPVALQGFFLAVLLGAVYSSFDSLLNSAATMLVLDVYEPLKKEKLSDEKLIKAAKVASVIIAIFSFIVSPLLHFAPQGLWDVIRKFTGFYNIPMISIVLVGLFTRRVPAIAPKISITFHLIAYGIYNWAPKVLGPLGKLHFIHMYGLLFAIEIAIMLIIGAVKPLEKPYTPAKAKRTVDLTPWKWAIPLSIVLVYCIVVNYLIFSPIGLVNGIGTTFWTTLLVVTVVALLLIKLSLDRWNKKYAGYVKNVTGQSVKA